MAEKKATEKKETKGIPVEANRPCYYGEVYRPEGTKFTVQTENEISIGMTRLDGKEHPNIKRRAELAKKKAEKADSRTKTLETPRTIKEAGEQLI